MRVAFTSAFQSAVPSFASRSGVQFVFFANASPRPDMRRR